MEFLYQHLNPGSFRPAYADTDSMCIGLSQTAIPKDGSSESYYRYHFSSWFIVYDISGHFLIQSSALKCANPGKHNGNRG